MGSAIPSHSPAAERNRGPIADVLRQVLPAGGRALEIASGTGQHVVHFAQALPGWRWQPTDATPAALASIDAWLAQAGVAGTVEAPLRLDVTADPWPVEAGAWDAVFCANMVHIAPWAACVGLMRGAARALRPGGRLVVYGPFLEDEVETAPSNLAFDADLKSRDPAWGLRRREDVAATAAGQGLAFVQRVAMPANNLVLVFERPAVHRARIESMDAGFDAPADRPLLRSALDAGLPLRSSCRNGACRACMCRLLAGSVRHVVEWPSLSPDEKAEGWVLPCVACPTSDVVLREAPFSRG